MAGSGRLVLNNCGTWEVGLEIGGRLANKIGGRARWDFVVACVKDNTLITQFLMWVKCSCILTCIL